MHESDARALFDDFLARMDRGELPDFEALVLHRPDLQHELRALFADECARLEAVNAARSSSGEPLDAFVDESLARLGRRAVDFDRYVMRGEIGKGGMGVVWHAWDSDLRRDIALKVVAPGSSALDRAARERFLEEAQITGQLDHPGIVPVHEIGLDPSARPYYTMKYVKGRTFAEVLEHLRARSEGWTTARALTVLQRVCEAMAYAHDKGVLHRDLKPTNVMVGAFGEVYVMDWGLARVIGGAPGGGPSSDPARFAAASPVESDRAARRAQDPSSSLLTADGQVVGTPAYMSPEQAAGRHHDIGPHTDVYAVGAMLYELLTGRPPHAGASRDERVADAPTDLPSTVPAELVAICERAMAHDWRLRYVDMREMARDVSDHLEGRVVRAHESGALAEARKWIRRNRRLAAALAFGALTLVAGTITSLAFKARSDAESRSATRVSAFLEEMLSSVKPSIARGRDTTLLRETLDTARARLDAQQLAASPASELRLMHLIGSIYRQIGNVDEAAPLLRRAAERAREQLERDDPLRPAIIGELGLLLVARGDVSGGELLAREALAERLRAHGGDHVDVASSLQNLADALRARGELGEAERHLREAVAMHERLGVDPEELARSTCNLAVVLQDRGELDEAEASARRALELARRRWDGDDPLIATCASTLGSILGARGELVAAEVQVREALEMQARLFTGDHADTAASHNNLAFLRYAARDLEGAERHFRAALEMQRRLVRGDHLGLTVTLDNLAAVLVARADRDGAEALQMESLAMRRRLFPDGHPDIALGLHNLAAGLRQAGAFERAEAPAREALAMGRQVLPAEHPNLTVFATNLGLILEARGDVGGAIRAFREALEADDRVAGTPSAPTPERTAQRERNLVRALVADGRYRAASTVLCRFDGDREGRTADRALQLTELHGAWARAVPALAARALFARIFWQFE